MTPSARLDADRVPARRIAVVGHTDAVDAWARALRACDLPTTLYGSIDDLLNDLPDPELGTVCIASRVRDMAALVKRAIIARKHVLAAAPVAESRQLVLLDELARNRARILLFDACGLGDEALEAVKVTARDEHPVRRARYIRAHVSAPGVNGLEDLTLEVASRILTLAGGLPTWVGAIVPRFEADDEEPAIMSLTLRFESGLLARIDVTSMEPAASDTITIMCDGRTTIVDSFNTVSPVRVLSSVRRHDAGGNASAVNLRSEDLAGAVMGREDRAALAFADALGGNEPISNARELGGAALVWETARSSMVQGGAMIELAGLHPLLGNARPQLHVIRGGGRTVETGSVPRLRVVRGGRRSEDTAPPPRSA